MLGRENKEEYGQFLTLYASCVVGKVLFNVRLRNRDIQEADLLTISDEAFALLVLENNFDRWIDIFEKYGCLPKGKVDPVTGNRKREHFSNVATKYTEGGIKFEPQKQGEIVPVQVGKGWSDKGIERFNELFDIVEEDRLAERNADFFDWYKNSRLKQKASENRAKKNKYTQPARHELFSEDEDAPVDDESSIDEDKYAE